MSSHNDPPDRDGFRKSRLTPRSPPCSSKRLFSEIESPTYATPEDRSSKRVQTCVSPNLSSPASESNKGYTDLMTEATQLLSKINEVVLDSRLATGSKTTIVELTQRVTGIVAILAVKSSCVETKLSNTERELDKFKTSSSVIADSKPVQNKLSYAESLKLRLPSKIAPAMESRAPLPCVVAYPTTERSADFASSSATKQALMKAIKPCDDGFQIVGVKKTAKSGVVLRVADERQIKKLESVAAIRTAGLRLEKPKGRRPRILVKDIPGSMEDAAFLTSLYRQNISGEIEVKEQDFIKSCKITRRRTLQNGRKWVGIELDANIRKHLVTTKDKLFIDWATCRFIDDVELVKCHLCQQFGHVRKHCTVKTPTCGNCAEAHESHDCPHINNKNFIPTCVACKRFKKPHDHRCGSPECGTYKAKLEQLILNTTY